MLPSRSERSLIYHDSVENISEDSDAVNNMILTSPIATATTSRGVGGGGGTSPCLSPRYPFVDEATPSSYVPKGVGVESKRDMRHFVKMERRVLFQSSRSFSEGNIFDSKGGIVSKRSSAPSNFNHYSSIPTLPNIMPEGSDEFSENGKIVPTPSDEYSMCDVFYNLIFGNYFNILLLFIPVAIISKYHEWGDQYIFWFNFAAMMPLASLLGYFTEEVAAHTNQTIGGLINASFGNAVEVVVAMQALLANEIRVVQASMIGSILSNLLLVLGCCFFFGGLRFKEQKFNSMVAISNMGLLMLSCIAFVLPTPFATYYDVEDEEALGVSRAAAVFLILMYLQLLIFQLGTHASLLEEGEEEAESELPFSVSIIGLVGITAIITKLSDYLVESIDGFCESSGISRTFVGIIILPIVGNAVEHATAVSVAMKNKMDLAMGVAIGSSTQISLFVAPLTVIFGWIYNIPMNLNFPHFEIILFILSVIVVGIVVSNSKTNWLEGSLLVTTYVMIAVGFWHEKVVVYKKQDAEL